MNAAAANALYDAERQGVPQLIGRLSDGQGGKCALGVLMRDFSTAWAGLNAPIRECSLCGATTHTYWATRKIASEESLIVHLNNDHKLSFAEIARKLGPDAA